MFVHNWYFNVVNPYSWNLGLCTILPVTFMHQDHMDICSELGNLPSVDTRCNGLKWLNLEDMMLTNEGHTQLPQVPPFSSCEQGDRLITVVLELWVDADNKSEYQVWPTQDSVGITKSGTSSRGRWWWCSRGPCRVERKRDIEDSGAIKPFNFSNLININFNYYFNYLGFLVAWKIINLDTSGDSSFSKKATWIFYELYSNFIFYMEDSKGVSEATPNQPMMEPWRYVLGTIGIIEQCRQPDNSFFG